MVFVLKKYKIFRLIMNKITFFSFIFAVFFSATTYAQDPNLAQEYFNNGEFEKAGVLFEKLYQQNDANDYFFERYIECYSLLSQYDKCEEQLKKQIKKRPKELKFLVLLGDLYDKQDKSVIAKEQYLKAIEKMPNDRNVVIQVASAFSSNNKYDMAIAAYEKGSEITKDKFAFSYYIADLYRNKGDQPVKMIENYLNSLQSNPNYLRTIQSNFARFLAVGEFTELQTQLYTRLQEMPDNVEFAELIMWVFTQKKDYKNALRQAKALDKKLQQSGDRVFSTSKSAEDDKDYDTAINGYEFIVQEIGAQSSHFFTSKRRSLDCRKKRVVEKQDYTQADLTILESEYEKFLTENGRSKVTAEIIMELADVEAFYLKNLPKAIDLLNEVINYPNIDQHIQAKAKLSLGNFYLINNERWESTLLYSQVDKAFKDDILGHEARFRNAKLSYFAGDFEWAQSQFDILKSSTSKLISNDAIDLSVFIMDNLGLDTITTPMEMYAQSELLSYQNRFDEAFLKLDSIRTKYPQHQLEDDVLWQEGQIYLKKREWQKAITAFQKIVSDYKEEIRADNALFALAQLYENQLNDKEKAKEYYEKVFMEYSSSVYAVDARKEFRRLRGDKVN
jgi:tetratricopeptide (TPR) repeat protein